MLVIGGSQAVGCDSSTPKPCRRSELIEVLLGINRQPHSGCPFISNCIEIRVLRRMSVPHASGLSTAGDPPYHQHPPHLLLLTVPSLLEDYSGSGLSFVSGAKGRAARPTKKIAHMVIAA
jgi:hypothetical protein